MKKAKITSLILIITAYILELLPFGAVCRFMGDPLTGTVIRCTYSYFDLTPFGYANFSPFLTALLSCLLISIISFSFFIEFNYRKPIIIVSTVAVITSLMPLLYGLDYYSVTALLITLIHAAIALVHFKQKMN